MAHQETCHAREEVVNEEDIDDYCKKIANFMQAQLHLRYDLEYSRKRLREVEQQEGTAPKDNPHVPNKWKGNLNPDSSKVKVPLNKECNSSKEHTEEKAHVLIKTTREKEREIELGGVEKG